MRNKLTAEFIGTFLLVFAGCGAVMVGERFPGTVPGFMVPLAFGLIVGCVIYGMGHISGAHINPAVTIAFTLVKRFPRSLVPGYLVAQFAGGICAILCLSALLPAGTGFGATVPSVLTWQAFVWEVLLTFILMFVIMGVATDSRSSGAMAGATIGATVMLCALFGGPVTGASMNPARTLAPNLFQGEVGSLWVYFAGPILGAVVAAWTYEIIREERPEQEAKAAPKPATASARLR